MRKFIIFVFSFVLLVGIAGVGVLYYIRPDPTLTLDYTSVSLRDKALDMIKQMSPEIVLTEEDLNNLLKEVLARDPVIIPEVEVRGAHFSLSGNRLTAELRIMWKDRVAAGVQMEYTLVWNEPDLIAMPESIRIKDISLPVELMKRIVMPIEQQLPSVVGIRDIQFGPGDITIKLRANIQDLLTLQPDS